MTKIEKRILDFIQKNVVLIFILLITICGYLMRICGINFESGDYQSFLLPWWDTISNNGIKGLATQVGNYNIPYQIVIWIMTLLPMGPLAAYKTVSILFDLVLAISAGMVVFQYTKNHSKVKAAVTYSLIWCFLPIVFNSAFWAQCDSIYVAFILLALYFLKKDKSILAFVCLGFAFAFKLQFVFILPLFIYYYFSTKKFSILHFFIIPLVDIVLCLPAIFMGRNPLDIINVYIQQTDYGKLIQMNCPNLYALMCDGADTKYYELFKSFSIYLTFAILGTALAFIIYKKVNVKSTETFLLTAIWSVFTCIMFLSSMHERYTYLLDILLIIYAVITFKRVWLPIVCSLISLRGYCFYLFNFTLLDLKTTAIVYFAVYMYVTYIFVKELICKKTILQDSLQANATIKKPVKQ